jgi:secondary thiamine-phosphate synthase enzyme
LFRAVERPPSVLLVPLCENGGVIVFEEFETKTGGRFDTLDVTEDVEALIERSGVTNGSALIFSPHTTCVIMIEKPDAEMRKALETTMESLAPTDGYYAHDDLTVRTENLVEDEPANAPGHIFHVLAGSTSECVPVRDGSLALGDGQRILFVELDGSRKRKYFVQILGSA